MIFNSFDFLIFFPIVFILHWAVFSNRAGVQNLFLLIASYFFYAWWDWRFLFLLFASTLATFYIGKQLSSTQNERLQKLYLTVGVLNGLAVLAFFKYFNFFTKSLVQGFSMFDIKLSEFTLNIVLPLGISFYTFRILSYLLDVNSGRMEPVRDWVQFFLYISFFPTLISGPIDRATNFIPQLQQVRRFNRYQAVDGLRQIVWGLFKKIVIADSCVPIIDNIFNNYESHSGSTLLLGAFLFAIQVYADFSGYSDLAIGVSSLLGLQVTRNFDNPYFAENITEHWRRWHISLTKWFTDYLYTPLTIAFRDWGKKGLILAILVNMLACGIWHGANWTFVVFGLLNGVYFIPFIVSGAISKKKTKIEHSKFVNFIRFRNILFTFFLVMLTDILFRSQTLYDAFRYYQGIFSPSLLSLPKGIFKPEMLAVLGCIAFMFLVEWKQQHERHPLQIDKVKSPLLRLAIYYTVAIIIFLFGSFSTNEFVYLQF